MLSGIFKTFFRKLHFVENLEITHLLRGRRGGDGHAVCVIMTHCVQKSICDSPLYLNTFENIEKMESNNLFVHNIFSKVALDLYKVEVYYKLGKHLKQNCNAAFSHL